jgi:hypothetical protein
MSIQNILEEFDNLCIETTWYKPDGTTFTTDCPSKSESKDLILRAYEAGLQKALSNVLEVKPKKLKIEHEREDEYERNHRVGYEAGYKKAISQWAEGINKLK